MASISSISPCITGMSEIIMASSELTKKLFCQDNCFKLNNNKKIKFVKWLCLAKIPADWDAIFQIQCVNLQTYSDT